MLTVAAWHDVPGLRHGFLDGEECAPGIAWEKVVAAAGAPLPIATVRQVHGVRIVSATAPGHAGADADGIVARAPGLLVGVVTADCMPVLMLARSGRAVAAVHAGWRGAAAGVLEEAVARLAAEYGVSPDALEVAIGPTVGPCCYEVGPEVLAAFRARTGDVAAGAWAASGERHRLDLRAAASLLLAAAGVRCTTSVGPCTACDVRYRSYRRDGPQAGRQLGFIGWE